MLALTSGGSWDGSSGSTSGHVAEALLGQGGFRGLPDSALPRLEALPELLPEMLPVLLAGAGILGLAVIMMLSVRRRLARRQAEERTPRERIEATRRAAAARARSSAGAGAIAGVQTRTPAYDGGRVEAHAAEASLLELSGRLAAQLDAKAVRLEQLMVEADEKVAELESLLAEELPLGMDAPPDAGAAFARVEIAPRRADALDPLHAAVYELADAGRTPIEIAAELDEHTGKVELILALRATARA